MPRRVMYERKISGSQKAAASSSSELEAGHSTGRALQMPAPTAKVLFPPGPCVPSLPSETWQPRRINHRQWGGERQFVRRRGERSWAAAPQGAGKIREIIFTRPLFSGQLLNVRYAGTEFSMAMS